MNSSQTSDHQPPLTRQEWNSLIASLRASGVEAEATWRRQASRLGGNLGSVKLVFQEQSGGAPRMVVRTVPILDLSCAGVGVKSHKPIAVGTGLAMQIAVDGVPHTLLGRVRHATPTLGGVRIGIEISLPEPDGARPA